MAPRSGKPTYTTDVICLKTYSFGEADKILHLYSPQRGHISAIAKGVKKPTSKLAGACEILNHSQVQLSESKSLHSLYQYQPVSVFADIRADIHKLAFGMLFADLVHHLSIEHDTDSLLIFDALRQALADLNATDPADAPRIATRFQVELMNIAGYQPNLAECMFTGEAVRAEEPYYCFSAQLGGIVQKAFMSHYPAASWVPVSTSTLRTLDDPANETLWQAANPLKVQKFLRYYYTQVFERPAKAYEFLFSLFEEETEPASAASASAMVG